MSDSEQANRVSATEEQGRQSGDLLSPSLESEIHDSISRALRLHKAETIAAEMGLSRNYFYKLLAAPEKFSLCRVPILARFDPDPEFLARVAGHLLTHLTASALARQAAGRAKLIIEEVSPGKWGRR